MRLLLLILFWSTAIWSAGHCGFAQLASSAKNHTLAGLARMEPVAWSCATEDYYENVQVDTTTHFRIFYVTSGPHAVASTAYVDTLKFWLEAAWNFHTDSLGMQSPQGPTASYHYQDSRFAQKYPVEIINLDMVRDGSCEGCYGLTLPDGSDPQKSTLLMENDFRYAPYWASSISWNGCNYRQAETPITSEIFTKNVDYSVYWNWALRVTAFHELYHACQLRYQDYFDHYHFWFESSAVGVEDLGAPDINDYLQYLPTAFSAPRNSLIDSNTNTMAVYSQSTFYHYLRHRFGAQFDHEIWSQLQKNPHRGIAYIFDDAIRKWGESSGMAGVYADYVQALVPSGERTLKSTPELIWKSDMPWWPNMEMSRYLSNADLPAKPFSYGLYPLADLADWMPANSSQLTKTIISLEDSSYVLVTAGFNPVVSANLDLPSVAYPNPWRGQGNLIFQVAQGQQISIYDEAGHRLTQLTVNPSTRKAIWTLAQMKSLAPGVYHWKSNSENRIHSFLIVY